MEIERGVSEFNGGIALLQRLHVSQIIISDSRRNLDSNAWYIELYNFHSELSSFMSNDEESELRTSLNNLNKQIQLNNRNANKNIPEILFNKLMDIELSYKKVMKDSHLLTKLKSDARFSLE